MQNGRPLGVPALLFYDSAALSAVKKACIEFLSYTSLFILPDFLGRDVCKCACDEFVNALCTDVAFASLAD